MQYWPYLIVDNLPWLLTLLLILMYCGYLWIDKKQNHYHSLVWRYGWMVALSMTVLVFTVHYGSHPGWTINRGSIDILNGPLVACLWVCWLLSKNESRFYTKLISRK